MTYGMFSRARSSSRRLTVASSSVTEWGMCWRVSSLSAWASKRRAARRNRSTTAPWSASGMALRASRSSFRFAMMAVYSDRSSSRSGMVRPLIHKNLFGFHQTESAVDQSRCFLHLIRAIPGCFYSVEKRFCPEKRNLRWQIAGYGEIMHALFIEIIAHNSLSYRYWRVEGRFFPPVSRYADGKTMVLCAPGIGAHKILCVVKLYRSRLVWRTVFMPGLPVWFVVFVSFPIRFSLCGNRGAGRHD